MTNPFDAVAGVVFDTTAAIMGYDAEWIKSEVETLTARVHYKEPSQSSSIGDKDYNPAHGIMEYKEGDFAGLIELLKKNKREKIRIKFGETWRQFLAYKPAKFFDGRVYKVYLQPED